MRNFIIWLTGLPSSGKSTVAKKLHEKLNSLGIKAQILDSDELRLILTPNPTYSESERDWFYRVLGWVAMLLYRNGVNVIIAATGNKRAYRDNVRSEAKDFIEVYVKCPLEVCKERDVKGIYRKALAGEYKTVPGVQAIYEEPLNPEVVIDTSMSDPNECANEILRYMVEKGYIKGLSS